MPKLAAIILFATAVLFAAQSFAENAPKKGTYASCLATAEKHGSSSRNAAQWCTAHGYTK